MKCRQKTDCKNPRIAKANKGGLTISKCPVRKNKKLRFIKEQEAIGFLSSLGIKTPLSQIPFEGQVLLCFKVIK